MKNTKILLTVFLLFTITLLAVSCAKEGPVYEKYLKMKNSTWDRFDQKIIEIPVEDIAKSLDITVVVRYTAQFTGNDFPLYIILTSLSGQEQIRDIKIPVRENSEMIGIPIGIMYEARVVLWKNIEFTEKGNYKISFENMIPKIQTAGIDEIGIVVTKSR